MNIPGSIQGLNQSPMPVVTETPKNVSPTVGDNQGFGESLHITKAFASGVEEIEDGIDLKGSEFAELDGLFDKAFNFAAPPMPDIIRNEG